jgi:hypothetical protein
MGIRLAHFVVERLRRRGEDVELIDAKAINLPMLRRAIRYRLAWHPIRDGHGGDFKHNLRWPDRDNAIGRSRSDRRRRAGA